MDSTRREAVSCALLLLNKICSCVSDVWQVVGDWMRTYSVADFRAACEAALQIPPADAFAQRVSDSRDGYHAREFVHAIPPVRPPPGPDNARELVQRPGDGTPWLSRFAPHVPRGNLENSTGALEGLQAYRINAASDRMRVLYVKSFKVGSTTAGSIVARMSLTRGLHVTPARLFSQPHPYPYDVLYAHNYFINGNSGGFPACLHVVNAYGPTWCGGYQPWMEFYMPRAWRLVIVAEPLARLASLYYYERGFTKAVIQDGKIARAKDNEQFRDPLDTDGRIRLRDYMLEYGKKRWDHVQWRWLREGTPDRSLDQVIEMLLNGAFLVGLTERFDETLLMWRHFMGLFVEDILYYKMKADFSHPKVTDWHPDDQRKAQELVERSGDTRYHEAAVLVFEHQVGVYGGWDKLNRDTAAFRAVNEQLAQDCENYDSRDQKIGVRRRHICMVAKYRALGLAAQFGEMY